MRRNHFGEAYCHSTDEVLDELNEKLVEASDIYLSEITVDRSSGKVVWAGDVRDNVTGDIVLYIETDTQDAVKVIAKACNIEDQS